jgi:hypothetical protein
LVQAIPLRIFGFRIGTRVVKISESIDVEP